MKAFRFTLVVVALLTLPWLTSITYGDSHSGSARGTVRIEVADRAPEATFWGCAFGSIIPGDLFYVDATSSPHSLAANLYLTNAQELTRYLRYLTLKVSVYSESEDGQWRQVPLQGSPTRVNGTYLTMQNSPVKFIVPGNARYKISIDSGGYYSLPARAVGDNEPPHFYLTVGPA